MTRRPGACPPAVVSNTRVSSVVVSARGEDRIRHGHPWIYQSDIRTGGRAARRHRRASSGRGNVRSVRALQRSIADHAADADARRRRCGRNAAAARIAAGRGVPRVAWPRRHRLPARERRSGSAAVARRRSLRRLPGACRRCRRGWIACCRRSRAALVESLAPAGILARNDPKVRLLEGLEQHVEGLAGSVPERRGPRGAGGVRRGPVVGAEDGTVPGSAREPRGRRPLRSRPPARLLQLQRRLRTSPGAAVRDGGGGGHLRRRGGADPRQRRAQRHRQARGARGQRFDELRRLERAGGRYDTIVLDPPAFAKNKAAVPKAPSPATRKSTSGRCGS